MSLKVLVHGAKTWKEFKEVLVQDGSPVLPFNRVAFESIKSIKEEL